MIAASNLASAVIAAGRRAPDEQAAVEIWQRILDQMAQNDRPRKKPSDLRAVR